MSGWIQLAILFIPWIAIGITAGVAQQRCYDWADSFALKAAFGWTAVLVVMFATNILNFGVFG